MKKILRNTMLMLPVTMIAAEAQPTPTEPTTFRIPRIETASTGYKLDGKLTDKVWEKAAMIQKFDHVSFNGKMSNKPVKSKTTVKMFSLPKQLIAEM